MNGALNMLGMNALHFSPHPRTGFLDNGAVSGKNKRSPRAVSVEMPVTAPGTGGSLYEVLRVEPTATISEIKTAYRSLAKVYHPDLSGNGRDFIEIHNAYETLSDPTARAVYDMSLVGRRRTTRTASFGCSGGSGFHPTRRWETDQCW
ncbi:hypothetical protein WN944_002345 [Citrus x changshan-huyou]|uniref:J domain-containing protein n=4 Tax=Citrus TaxID=2706 RepID=A0ACB8P2V1_CITSI|nr:chaperone protein dnaJ 11, chloroplastic [Citrus x clementina]ESR65962.1 hypothetical protein CICLE_v10009810mg [Citrus x clementina]KAH9804462.1 J domain-containing protein [Citrus sinensis]KDO74035.1 hypothetical protein CISIN_1g042521mg [Citrus sinensis]